MSLSNQSTLINLHPNQYNKEIRYYTFAVNLDKCVENRSTLDIRVCFAKLTEDLNLHVFNMITGANASRKLTNHISCKCECKFNCRKCNLNQKWNNDKCRCDCENKKKSIVCKKQWNPAACSCDNGKYAKSAVDNSVVYMR